MDSNPTIFHVTQAFSRRLAAAGFHRLSERDPASVERGHCYQLVRDDSNLVALRIGSEFEPGRDSLAIAGAHIDANRVTLKPSSMRPERDGLVGLGVAPYAGGLSSQWWNRDLGLGGRVVVRGRGIGTRLVRLPGVVGIIPSLAPHFGAPARESDKETNQVPVVAQAGEAEPPTEAERGSPLFGQHSLQVLRAVAREAGCAVADLLGLELELFSAEKAAIAGLNGEFINCSRLDDRLCAYAAVEGLLAAAPCEHAIQIVALFDNEEIGSLSRRGAQSNLLQTALSIVFGTLGATADEVARTAARSLLVSADVAHAGNPNYQSAYLEGHIPRLNTGVATKVSSGVATDTLGAVLARIVSEHAHTEPQVFAPRNDTSSGGTIGQMLSAALGIRTVDVGIPVLSMHSIREVTGARDVELGQRWFRSFYELALQLSESTELCYLQN